MVTSAPRNSLATAGLVLGVSGVMVCWMPVLGLLPGLLGVIFGAIGIAKARRRGGVGRSEGIAGLATGILSLGLAPLVGMPAFPPFKEPRHEDRPDSVVELERLERRIEDYYADHAELPPSAAEMPGPAGTACSAHPGHELEHRSFDDYQRDPGWKALGFYISRPTAFTFKWTRQTPTTGMLVAIGDLDCDQTLTTLRYDITVMQGAITVARHPATPD